MTDIAVFLPWWGSLDSVREIHSKLEAISIGFFALLVAFDSAAHFLEKNHPERSRIVAGIGLVFFWIAVGAEIVGYKYGQRNDELSGEQIRSLDALATEAKGKARDAKETADGAKTKADAADITAGLAKGKALVARNLSAVALERATSARQEADEVKEKLADRVLSPLQKIELGGRMRAFIGQEYTVTAYWQSRESLDFANQLHEVLISKAHWKYNPEGSKSQMLGGQVGVFVWTHPGADERTLAAAKSLVEALQGYGFTAHENKQNAANPKTNIIGVNVGSKN